eukprot:NODE_2855_length_458_cov_52.061125_g2257_i0.p2 GENE.NODE_2855_length_458_cov_52.061125_g2257_i0~~NODE_2855_length_458_cov_52.061125_g2257_i0.p2  ORF type:complete len:73 (+),score=11.31 NODE_2855_length_458_cov_52.061125_g2257_i0:45-263(+)
MSRDVVPPLIYRPSSIAILYLREFSSSFPDPTDWTLHTQFFFLITKKTVRSAHSYVIPDGRRRIPAAGADAL